MDDTVITLIPLVFYIGVWGAVRYENRLARELLETEKLLQQNVEVRLRDAKQYEARADKLWQRILEREEHGNQTQQNL